MKRRQFVRDVAMVTSGFSVLSMLTRCNPAPGSGKGEETTDPDEFELSEVTVRTLQDGMEKERFTARSIAEMYITRIQEIDRDGPRLNSVVELNPDALAVADELDRERKSGKVRGLLHGIPILIKDNIDTADKMMTTAGSLALNGHIAAKDASIVAQLRDAGAVILGKTNLSEWANFRSTRSSSGWSSRGGQTKNPYALDRSPCGSSSGSGAAVAANLCALAVGTETNGSIACPSSTNGVVGIKPTVGLWSRSGIIPISGTQDTAGPMARTVEDAAILLGALTKKDERDPVSSMRTSEVPPAYTSFLKTDGLANKIIGVEKSFRKGHEAIDQLLENALDVMRQKGAVIVEVELVEQLKGIESLEFEFLKIEFKDGLNRYLAATNGPVRTLKDVIEYNQRNDSSIMPFFKQEILVDSESKPGVDSDAYKRIYDQLINGTREKITAVFNQHKLDALCGPTNGPSWCIDLVNGDFFTGYGMYSPAAVAGYPSITVPMGAVLGLPVGLTFMARAYQEPRLIEVAYAYEQASLKRFSPPFLRTVS
jgi:amidase